MSPEATEFWILCCYWAVFTLVVLPLTWLLTWMIL